MYSQVIVLLLSLGKQNKTKQTQPRERGGCESNKNNYFLRIRGSTTIYWCVQNPSPYDSGSGWSHGLSCSNQAGVSSASDTYEVISYGLVILTSSILFADCLSRGIYINFLRASDV